MAIKTRETKNTLYVSSTLHEDVPYFIGSATRQTKMGMGGKYYNFANDNPLNSYTDREVAVDQTNKLAVANVVMGISLWKRGIEEVNNYIRTYRGNFKNVKAKVPGIDMPIEEEVE